MMKKFFAILLALAVLFAFAACGSTQTPAKTPETTAAPETTAPEVTEPAVPIGTLYVSFSGTMELTYDKDGNALEIKGTNEVGETLATAAQNQVGKGCVFALLNSLGWWCRNTNTPGSLALSKTASPPAWNVEDKHSPIFPS